MVARALATGPRVRAPRLLQRGGVSRTDPRPDRGARTPIIEGRPHRRLQPTAYRVAGRRFFLGE